MVFLKKTAEKETAYSWGIKNQDISEKMKAVIAFLITAFNWSEILAVHHDNNATAELCKTFGLPWITQIQPSRLKCEASFTSTFCDLRVMCEAALIMLSDCNNWLQWRFGFDFLTFFGKVFTLRLFWKTGPYNVVLVVLERSMSVDTHATMQFCFALDFH